MRQRGSSTVAQGIRFPLPPLVMALSIMATSLTSLFSMSASLWICWIMLALALARIALQDRWLSALAREIAPELQCSPAEAIRTKVLQLDKISRSLSTRLVQRHGVSGLPTRELLVDAMECGPGVLGVIEFVDFDRLGAIDPARADRVLNIMAQRIVRMTGEGRIVAQVDRARFAIWFDDLSEGEAKVEFQAIAYALQDRMISDEAELLPVIRTGHLLCDPAEDPPEKLLSRALAILGARGAGEGRNGAGQAVQIDFALEQDLRRAITAGEFELWFQPFIDSARRSVCGAEALLRWRHPIRGLVPPSEFIPIAEAVGLAEEIGLWVLNSACRAAQGWNAAGLVDLKIAVNVSAQQLDRPDLGALVERTLASHALSPEQLEVELTETVAAVDSHAIAGIFGGLRGLGVSVSIDDFGTGYSSLSYLKNLSFDKLKIDREFVTDVDRRQDCQAICQSIITLGRGLGTAVLAEGVEQRAEMEWLQRSGCHLFQGYYFSRPLPAAEFIAFVKDRDALARLLAPAQPTMRAAVG